MHETHALAMELATHFVHLKAEETQDNLCRMGRI